jgi:DNA-binding CsgD family transcriptional regulator
VIVVKELSPQEKKVVHRIGKGINYREISEELGLSYDTVKTYVARIRKKLGKRSKVQIALWAVEQKGKVNGRVRHHS